MIDGGDQLVKQTDEWTCSQGKGKASYNQIIINMAIVTSQWRWCLLDTMVYTLIWIIEKKLEESLAQ